MNLILTGYMGCGKTSAGKILASVLGYDFYDLDALIVEREGQAIDEIFQRQGEERFRQIERKALKVFLQHHTTYVLSVGGGAPCYHDNMALMNEYAKTIYLRASVSVLFQRLRFQKSSRPMIAQFADVSLYEFIIKHLSGREIFYEKAHERIDIDGKSVQQIVREIKKQLGLRDFQ